MWLPVCKHASMKTMLMAMYSTVNKPLTGVNNYRQVVLTHPMPSHFLPILLPSFSLLLCPPSHKNKAIQWKLKQNQLTDEKEVDEGLLMMGSVCVAMSLISTVLLELFCTINISVSAYSGSFGPQATAFSIDAVQVK